MGFEMDKETSGVVPVCSFVLQKNFDSIVLCSYLWLLKDNLCCEYRCFHGPSVCPMYVLVSSVGVVTVALVITLCVLQLPCSRHCVCFGNYMVHWVVCFLVVS